jgi:hypothetical protein
MATFSRIKSKNQSCRRMLGALAYVLQGKKVRWNDERVESGVNCMPYSSYLEMMTTKQRFDKTDGVCFFHFVQSFSEEERITPWQANEIARELTEKLFPGYEAVVATHSDTDNIHSHIIVNSVSYENGKKLHIGPKSIEDMRQVSDEICMKHGLSILEPYTGDKRKKRLSPGEYRAAERCESWKFALMQVINETLEYAKSREDFIENMEFEGYDVRWDYAHKFILFTTPEGKKCRDRSLHDDTYLKENLEKLFDYRQATGFEPGTLEPENGWLGEMEQGVAVGLFNEAVRLGRHLEMQVEELPIQMKFAVESKVTRREALKKMAQGHNRNDAFGYDFQQRM